MVSGRPHVEKWSPLKRKLSIITATIENIAFCGLWFGWPSIMYVYERSCYYVPETTDGFKINGADIGVYSINCQNSGNETKLPLSFTENSTSNSDWEKVIRDYQSMQLNQ